MITRRNPLKSGQCFLQGRQPMLWNLAADHSRNPLKSGQCFLQKSKSSFRSILSPCRNPLKSGQCFLQAVSEVLDESGISQSQSPQIGSMFLTK